MTRVPTHKTRVMDVTMVLWILDDRQRRCLKYWISPPRTCAFRVPNTNIVTCDPHVTPGRLYLPVSLEDLFLESSRENTRILSDWTLWRSSRIHRTVVTFVTIVLFHPYWPPEAVLKALDDPYQQGHKESNTHLTHWRQQSLDVAPHSSDGGWRCWRGKTLWTCQALSMMPQHR